MADEQKPKLENLEPNRETSQELTNDEAEAAQGGCLAGEHYKSGDWGIGGRALTTADVHALAAGER